MSLGGNIIPVENPAESLQVAHDAGAKRVLLPMASVSDIPTIPGELFAKFRTSFYSDPRDAPASFVLMLIGVGAIVGTCILFFYLKAFHVEPFPRAWKLIAFVGTSVSFLAIIPAMFLAGPRTVFRFGSLTLVVGVGMLVFGFVRLAEPS